MSIRETAEEARDEIVGRDASIAHHWTASSNSEDREEIVEFNENRFLIQEIDIYIESAAGIDVSLKITADGDQVAPDRGEIAGGGEEMRLRADYLVAKRTSIRAHWTNDDSSDRELQVVLHGMWVE